MIHNRISTQRTWKMRITATQCSFLWVEFFGPLAWTIIKKQVNRYLFYLSSSKSRNTHQHKRRCYSSFCPWPLWSKVKERRNITRGFIFRTKVQVKSRMSEKEENDPKRWVEGLISVKYYDTLLTLFIHIIIDFILHCSELT